MRKSSTFNDKAILETPTSIHSSSMSADKQKTSRQDRKLEKSLDRISDAESSLGILSSLDISNDRARAAERLQRERALAVNFLNRCDFTSLPSRLLKPSELSLNSPKENLLSYDSTISESDLLPPGNSSTPRQSLLASFSNFELQIRDRPSIGNVLTNLALSVTHEEDLGKVLDQYRKTIDPDLSFCPGEEALEQLEKDEMSWKRKHDIPASPQEFSVTGGQSQIKMSMGSFFQKRSDSLSALVGAKSPEKNRELIPLIEASSYNITSDISDGNLSGEGDSLSISAIAQILSDSKQTPFKAMNYFMQCKKNPKSSKIQRASTPTQKYEEISEENCIVSRTLEKPINKTENSTITSKNSYREVSTFELEGKHLGETPGEACKENVDTLNIRGESPDFNNHEKSIVSSRSSSSLSSLPNGKLPVATTKTELIWGCIKPGKNISQEFIMKNKSSSRIGVKCSVSNPSFRLIKDGGDNFSNHLKVILHPYESRTVTVTFAPTNSGAAVDYLYFSPINPNQTQTVKQFIRLFGYGGYGNVVFTNVVKDIAGKFLLSLGYIENQDMIKKYFNLKNAGTLPSFAYIGFVSNGLYLFTNVVVTPPTLVLLPDEEKEVVITYTPKKEDRTYLQSKVNSSVIDIGKLTVIYGTEVDRGRLRKLCAKAKDKGLELDPAFENLVKKFPGEAMPSDLKLLREPISGLDEILKLIDTKEIVITLEQDLDRTVIEPFHNETAMFHSLCENTKIDMFENTAKGDIYHVEPSTIILTPPEKYKDIIFLKNGSMKKIYFEVSFSPKGLDLKPSSGTVQPGECFVINLAVDGDCKDNIVYKVKVLVDNEFYEVDVKVMHILQKAT